MSPISMQCLLLQSVQDAARLSYAVVITCANSMTLLCQTANGFPRLWRVVLFIASLTITIDPPEIRYSGDFMANCSWRAYPRRARIQMFMCTFVCLSVTRAHVRILACMHTVVSLSVTNRPDPPTCITSHSIRAMRILCFCGEKL
jgi:hypothetical protein